MIPDWMRPVLLLGFAIIFVIWILRVVITR
jgi:hypothetical protein